MTSPLHSDLDLDMEGYEVSETVELQLVREADVILRNLQHLEEPAQLRKALYQLRELFICNQVKKYLEDNQVHMSVIFVMKNLTSFIDIQQIGIQLLKQFLEDSWSLERNMKSEETCVHVLKVMQENNSDLGIQSCGMKILSCLLTSKNVRSGLLESGKLAEVLEVIVTVATAFQENSNIQLSVLKALIHMLQEGEVMQEVLVQKHLVPMMELLSRNSERPEVVCQIFDILCILACRDHLLQMLVDEKVHLQVIPHVKISEDCDTVLEVSLRLLARLSRNYEVVESQIKTGFIMASLVPVMLGKVSNPGIQLAGLNIFQLAAAALFQSDTSLKLGSQWLKVIYLAMSKQMESPAVQEACCFALSCLLECQPEAYIWIGESSYQKQDPLHSLCLGAIMMYEQDAAIYTAACKALYLLAADNDSLCKHLMQKNAHIAVMAGLKIHRTDPQAVSVGCRALRGLCIFNDEYKMAIWKENDVLSILSSILHRFPLEVSVQREAITTIACLSDIDTVRHQCFVKHVHLKVLNIFESFPADEILQEAAIETLAILAGAASGAEILNSAGGFTKIISCLKQFSNNIDIQKKGLMAVQILADVNLLTSEVMCDDLAILLRSIMMSHNRVIGIQREAVVAIQILAEKSQLMSEVMVNRGCHEVLFRILETYDANQSLHDLASECLYVIGCVQNLKSRMLLSACAKGFLAGVECLMEIGADVNIGDGQETPLFYAVKNGDAKMVQLLLSQNVTDVKPSLKLSLEKKSHGITGMLLAHIGQDKGGSSLIWSGYELGDLHQEWFIPSLRGIHGSHSSSGAGRHLVDKLKLSEEKRKRRLHHSPSDSELEIFRHKFFRFQRSSDSLNDFSRITEKIFIPTRSRRPRSLPKGISLQLNYEENQRKLEAQKEVPKKQFGENMDGQPEMSSTSLIYPLDRHLLTSLNAETSTSVLLNNSEVPAFDHSIDDLKEWKERTLTGANIPFSPSDPRQRGNKNSPIHTLPKEKWLRKLSLMKAAETSYATFGHQSDVISEHRLQADGVNPQHNLLLSGSLSEETGLESSIETSQESLTDLPRVKYEITIKYLDVAENKIHSLHHLAEPDSKFLRNFSGLEKLDISNNQLESLPNGIFEHLPKLQNLDLRNNQLTKFPREVGHCTRLICLDLARNKISAVGAEDLSSGTYNLRELSLSSNAITDFPKAIDQFMPYLETLSLSKNKLKKVPQAALQLPKLHKLNLSHNNLRTITEPFLSMCHQLETLEAVNNKLEVLPSDKVAKLLPRLSTLRLKNNRLVEKDPFFIPKLILELPSLRIVDLSQNGLEGFPPPIMWKSQILKEVLLSRNSISKLNLDGAKAWSKLEKFHIARNKISELPKDIGHLVSLQSLDISRNKMLTTLPDELGRCCQLWEMPLNGLSLDLDDSLLKSRVKDLVRYLHNRLKKAKRYFRMKLMVVGYGDRGKTTLLQALRKGKRQKDKPTVGVIVDDWRYDWQRSGKKFRYTLSTWDFAGQEEFYSTHQCFLSNRALYLVVYDFSRGAGEIEKLKPWLSNIFVRAPGCPVIIVGTHFDKLSSESSGKIIEEVNRKLEDLAQKPGFPEISWTAVVDCLKETPELENLRHKVKDVIDNYSVRGQPVMGQKVPASYVRLAELLSEEATRIEATSIPVPVIRQSRLLQIVRNEGLDLEEEEELQQAVRFLHEGGVLLHYNETALQLRDLYFINPGWLCRMMAQIVTVPMINPFITSEGIMKKESVNWLFRGTTVDEEARFSFLQSLIPQYLRLLEKFEIALPRNEDELLVPCRLPEDRPNITLPAKHGNIHRFYVMPYTPLGFWSRLITRLIVFSQSNIIETMMHLEKVPVLKYWRRGIYVCWCQDAFFLLDEAKEENEEVHITVPATTKGCQLLGFLVDHIDALIDEWFPGLTSIDPLLGRELLEKFVPCGKCTGADAHRFRMEELLEQSEKINQIFCPRHQGLVHLTDLAPDVMLHDLEEKFHMITAKFELKESPEFLLGDGGFGSVYCATYKQKVVAAKVYSAIGDVHPHKMLRQEATILRRLKHPSVVSLLAVGLRPCRVMVLEFAPVGSLGSLLKNGKPLSRILQHRISVQIAEGLLYLHQLMVVYRDLKPDNVLIFSLSPSALINAKISDYGISQFSTLYGLMAQEGTPAYRAPEVIRRENYSFQADIFSFGITLYVLLTGGQHPFDELEFKSEMDKAFADNRPFPAITQRQQAPWPDMQDLINHCVHQVPEKRPGASDVWQRLTTAELFCLKEELPVSVGTTVECMACQVLEENNVKLWVASGDRDYMQLSWINLVDYLDDTTIPKPRSSVDYSGRVLRQGRILCILPVDSDHILLGTQLGKVWLYNAVYCELVHSTNQLPDAVLSMYLLAGKSEDPLVLVGMANGRLAFYPLSEILQEPNMDPLGLNLGQEHEPVRCLLQTERKLIASCGTKVIVIDTRFGMAVEKVFDTVQKSVRTSQAILTMAVGRHLFLSRRRSSVLEVWDIGKERQRESCDISMVFKLPHEDARITSVLQDNRALWVGTGGGQIAILDAVSLSPIVITSRHTAPVRCLISIKSTASRKYSVVLSGGLGFRLRPGADFDKDNQYGCIAVWDADFPQLVKSFNDDVKKRQELACKMSRIQS